MENDIQSQGSFFLSESEMDEALSASVKSKGNGKKNVVKRSSRKKLATKINDPNYNSRKVSDVVKSEK